MASATSKRSLTERTARALAAAGVTQHASVLVAVSGGRDSMAMLHVLAELQKHGGFAALHAVHVNHSLRGMASDADEAVVREYCLALHVSLSVVNVTTANYAEEQKQGIEEAAREQRYRCFEEIARELRAEWIITAHTANDQAETVLMNIVRGAGLNGLSGIPGTRPLRGVTVIRPWLDVKRSEVDEYASKYKIAYCDDATNATLDFQRNRVRHLVLPAFRQAYPDRDVVENIAKLAQRIARVTELIRRMADETCRSATKGASLDLSILRQQPELIAVEAIESWLTKQVGRYRLTSDERDRFGGLIEGRIRKLELRRGIRILSEAELLTIEDDAPDFEPVSLSAIQELHFAQGMLRVRSATTRALDNDHLYLDLDLLGKCEVRPWREGDTIEPFGMPGKSKLVSNLLTDAGLTGFRRRRYPVVVNLLTGKLLWVPGVRAAESTRVAHIDAAGGLFELVWRSSRHEQ